MENHISAFTLANAISIFTILFSIFINGKLIPSALHSYKFCTITNQYLLINTADYLKIVALQCFANYDGKIVLVSLRYRA
jgi:hypothetical protein